MNLKQYFTYQYLFQINTAYITPLEKIFLFFGLAIVLLGVVMKIASMSAPSPTDKKFRSKFSALFFGSGLASVIWYLCHYENVKFFGTHFMMMLVVLVSVFLFARLLIKLYKSYGQEKSLWEKEQIKLKYLPK